MSHLWFLGDVHGSFAHIKKALDATHTNRPEALIFLGDQECPRPFEECVAPFEKKGIKSYFIIGNHDADTPENIRNLFSSEFSTERNLDGRVVTIAGLRIAGLGGVFRGKIWYPQGEDEAPLFRSYDDFLATLNARRPTRLRRHVTKSDLLLGADPQAEAATKENEIRNHLASIFPDDYDRLASLKADILVTHEAPAPHPNGFRALAELGFYLGVHHSFHGHQHDCLDYSAWYETLGYKPHGVGLRGISDELGNVICPGELDAGRNYRLEKMVKP